MKRTAFALLVLLALSSRAHAQTSLVPTPKIATTRGRKDTFPPVEVNFPDGVSAMPGVRYWTPAGFRPLTMDIYFLPKNLATPAGGYPMVMFIHGGGWIAGNSQALVPFADFPGVLASIAARGYVVASVNYRLSGSVLHSADVKHELVVMPGMNHSLIGATYDATRDANLNALQKPLQFIDQTIGTPSRR